MASIRHGTNALVVILGTHGGGVANVKWLLRHGARVTVTDMRTREELAHSISAFTPEERKKIRFVLGGQKEEDFKKSDLILLGAGVQKKNPWRALALSLDKEVENDTSLFLSHARHPVIAVTGTRGKSTTTGWIAALLAREYPGVRPSGNTPENALLKEIDRRFLLASPHVAELSSWQLELAPRGGRSPHIALIMNLYPDHLNTYDGMEDYADAKAGIFAHQTSGDILVLNADDKWTRYFLSKKPTSQIRFFSLKPLPKGKDGVYLKDGYVFAREKNVEKKLVHAEKFIARFGEHNLANLLAAITVVRAFDPSLRTRESDILSLAAPRMREEIIYEDKKLCVVNDSTATSPDATIAALKRFSKDKKVFLIAGGTDKDLDMTHLAKVISKTVPPNSLTLIGGSATEKLMTALESLGYKAPRPKETLEECAEEAFVRAKAEKEKVDILFSPGAASFGKFKHEFDRGEKWNEIVGKSLRSK